MLARPISRLQVVLLASTQTYNSHITSAHDEEVWLSQHMMWKSGYRVSNIEANQGSGGRKGRASSRGSLQKVDRIASQIADRS